MADDVPMEEGGEDAAMNWVVDSDGDDEMADVQPPAAVPSAPGQPGQPIQPIQPVQLPQPPQPQPPAAVPSAAAAVAGSPPPPGVHPTNAQPGLSAASPPTPPPETDAATSKRRAIQAILRDTSLPDVDRRRRIQTLMDGTAENTPEAQACPQGAKSTEGLLAGAAAAARAAAAAGEDGNGGAAGAAGGGGTGSGTGATAGAAGGPGQMNADEAISCVHYERRCNIVAPCCNKIFGCRVCHDEMTPPPGHGAMDRFSVKEIVCKDCKTRQPSGTNRCINPNCAIQFGEYHCGICNLWMVQSKRPFHCDACGFCRVGGRESFRHCDRCCMCISVNVYDDHNCMKDKYKNNCPVCREDMFSSRQSPQDLPCGHAIHAHCFRKLAGFDYRCPICKKTVVSQQSMAAAWATRARDIEMQPMPADLARVVNIMCNDCETRSENRNWHFLGVQCPHCTSFNTVVEQVISSGENGAAANGGAGGAGGAGAGPGGAGGAPGGAGGNLPGAAPPAANGGGGPPAPPGALPPAGP